VAHEGLTNRFCVPLDENFRQATLIFPLTIAPYLFVLGNNAGSWNLVGLGVGYWADPA